MDIKKQLYQAVMADDKKTGFREIMLNMALQDSIPDEGKVQYMFNAFESSKPKWSDPALDGNPIACKKGCSYCCHLNVDVLKIEMDYIWKRAKKDLSALEIESIKQQAKVNYEAKKDLDHEGRLKTRLVCPFLDQNTSTCSIYAYRPLSCRGMYSTDLQACIDGMTKDVQNSFWAAPWLISDDIISGLALGLSLKQDNPTPKNNPAATLERAVLLQDNPNFPNYEH